MRAVRQRRRPLVNCRCITRCPVRRSHGLSARAPIYRSGCLRGRNCCSAATLRARQRAVIWGLAKPSLRPWLPGRLVAAILWRSCCWPRALLLGPPASSPFVEALDCSLLCRLNCENLAVRSPQKRAPRRLPQMAQRSAFLRQITAHDFFDFQIQHSGAFRRTGMGALPQDTAAELAPCPAPECRRDARIETRIAQDGQAV